jgi:hypothetical protein
MTLAPFFSAGIKVSQDLDTVLVRPVVEDRSEEVHVCILDGLWREKVMVHVRDPLFELRRQGISPCGSSIFEILNNE